MNLFLLATLTFVATVTGSASRASTFRPVGRNRAFIGRRVSIKNTNPLSNDVAEAFKASLHRDKLVSINSTPVAAKTPRFSFLKWAYSACGIATAAAWTTIVLTTIRANQPIGMMMPSYQHGIVNRMSVLSAIPLMASSITTLRSADSWEKMSSTSCRRQNLALVAAGVGSALWVAFAPVITKIPGTVPLASHQAYSGALRSTLIGAFASTATLCATVWARSLPEDIRKNPLLWPGRVADGVCNSLVSLAPASNDDPVNVKYSLLSSGLLFLTGLQLLGPHPVSVIPSWTGRRLARIFPAWTLLAAVTAFDLKEATENGQLRTESKYRTLSNGLYAFGAVHLASKMGAVFFDPSFPASYHAVQMVPGWATAASLLISLALRSDDIAPTGFDPFRDPNATPIKLYLSSFGGTFLLQRGLAAWK